MPLNEEQRKRIEEEAVEAFPSRLSNGMNEHGMFTFMDDRPREREGYAAACIKNHELHEESLRLLKSVTDSRYHDHNEPKYCSMCRHITTLSSLVGGAKNEQR